MYAQHSFASLSFSHDAFLARFCGLAARSLGAGDVHLVLAGAMLKGLVYDVRNVQQLGRSEGGMLGEGLGGNGRLDCGGEGIVYCAEGW